jgi:gamma-glutamylputrescine oxidase
VEGLRLLQQRIAQHGIDCDWQPGYLSLAVKPRKSRELRRWMDHVEASYGYPLQWIAPQEMRELGRQRALPRRRVRRGSGHLHPLKYCLGLARRRGRPACASTRLARVRRGARRASRW